MITLLISCTIIGLTLVNLKRIKDFHPFNSWLILFSSSLLLFPLFSAFILLKDFVGIMNELPMRTIKAITIPSLFGGVSLFLLFNSIRKLQSVTSLLVYAISSLLIYGLFSKVDLAFWILPFIMIIGIVVLIKTNILNIKLWLKEALLPIIGGFASFGFVRAFQVEPITISELVVSFGNQPWQVLLFQFSVMLIASGIFVFPIFLAQMSQKNAWMYFDTPHLLRNVLILVSLSLLIFLTAFFGLYFSQVY